MKKKLLNSTLRLVLVDGKSQAQIYITQEIVDFNPKILMDRGWANIGPGDCPPATLTYYWMKIEDECVKVPY